MMLIVLWGALVPPDIEYRRELERERFWLIKVFGDDRHDLVVTGDSRVYRGLSPDDIAATAPGRSVFNYGFSSGIFDEELLARAEARLAPAGTRELLIAISPHALTAKRNEHLAELLRTPREERLLKRGIPSLPLFFHRLSPQRFIDLLAGKDILNDTSNYREAYDARTGWVASSYLVEKGEEGTLRSYREMRAKFPVSPDRVAALRDRVAALRDRGVTVYFLYLPSSDRMRELEREWPGFDYAMVRRALESAGAVSLDDAVPPGLHSYDGSHLDERSARLLSRSLGAAIARKRSGE